MNKIRRFSAVFCIEYIYLFTIGGKLVYYSSYSSHLKNRKCQYMNTPLSMRGGVKINLTIFCEIKKHLLYLTGFVSRGVRMCVNFF
jgi:hypothetical protein